MSAHAFCGGVNSSAFNGVKRVISSARLAGGAATRAATPNTASHFFMFLSLTGADVSPHGLIPAAGSLVRWTPGSMGY